MPEDPIQPLIDQLASLMKFAETSASKSLKGPLDPEIYKRIEKVEDAIQLLKKINQKSIPISKTGSSSENALKKYLEDPKQFTPRQQKLLRQCLDLGVHAVILRVGLLSARKKAGRAKQYETGKNTKKSIQKRRKKFKGIGEGEKWKRL